MEFFAVQVVSVEVFLDLPMLPMSLPFFQKLAEE
jgi:hypothetical protein